MEDVRFPQRIAEVRRVTITVLVTINGGNYARTQYEVQITANINEVSRNEIF